MVYYHAISRVISIHAPREGGDSWPIWSELYPAHFNPRPPRGGRLLNDTISHRHFAFQSTPPARGATNSQNVGG